MIQYITVIMQLLQFTQLLIYISIILGIYNTTDHTLTIDSILIFATIPSNHATIQYI